MSGVVTVVGIDPGLVHTGVVIFHILRKHRELRVEHLVIEGDDSHAVQLQQHLDALAYTPDHIFIESYRERGKSYGTNTPMRKLLHEFRRRFPKAEILDNTGVKKVVRPALLQVLGLDDFPTTHHQDLESAARIMVLGLVKDPGYNETLADIVVAQLHGRGWTITK